MISDFEAQLATVLGAQLDAPFAGMVKVAGSNDTASGNQPGIYVGVFKTESKAKGFGNNRNIEAPGVTDRIHVLSATVYININVFAANNAGRIQHLQGIEEIMYLLDEESFQTGTALIDTGDQGFRIDQMNVTDTIIQVSNAPESNRPPGISLVAEGIFWPIGVSGKTGVEIDEIRVRGLLSDLQLDGKLPQINAGDSTFDINILLPKLTAQRIGGDNSSLNFNRIAVDLQQEGGQPGAGSLSGGIAGTGSVRLVNIIDSTATLNYTPPANPAVDILRVGYEDGENGLGQIVKQFKLEVL